MEGSPTTASGDVIWLCMVDSFPLILCEVEDEDEGKKKGVP